MRAGDSTTEVEVLAVGSRVSVHGLSRRPELNGLVGLIEEWVPEKERWGVRVKGRAQLLSLRPDNLQVASKTKEEVEEERLEELRRHMLAKMNTDEYKERLVKHMRESSGLSEKMQDAVEDSIMGKTLTAADIDAKQLEPEAVAYAATLGAEQLADYHFEHAEH